MAETRNYGAFIATTSLFDAGRIAQLDPKSEEFKQLLVKLYQTVNNISILLNLKDTGYYVLDEFINSQLFFPNPALSSTTAQAPTFRQVFRKVINFGQLPNTGTTVVAHGLAPTNAFTFTRIYGAASDTTGLNYIPLPYASPTPANNIELRVDNTNVIITTGSNRTNFNVTYVVLEFIKQ